MVAILQETGRIVQSLGEVRYVDCVGLVSRLRKEGAGAVTGRKKTAWRLFFLWVDPALGFREPKGMLRESQNGSASNHRPESAATIRIPVK
jgi:hypothetical protein